MSIGLLEAGAANLRPVLSRVVFLGGATIDLWITDPAAREPRITYDVDVVAEVVTLGAYEEFQRELRQAGLREDTECGVICRWRSASDLIIDVVPAEPRLAGFGGRWLSETIEAAVEHVLPSGITIRVVPPPCLVATKLEAFADRGQGDCLASKDFEDIVLIIDGRQEFGAEVEASKPDLREFLEKGFARLLTLPHFVYGVEGALLGADASARARAVTIPRFEVLAGRAPHSNAE